MYRFLDRPVVDLDPAPRLLLAAARLWVATALDTRRPASVVAPVADAFARTGAIEALGDFAMAMTTLERDAGWMLRLSPPGAPRVGEDEARLLALFAAGLAGRPSLVRRLAAALVEEEAVPRLSLAVELVATRITDGVFMERGR